MHCIGEWKYELTSWSAHVFEVIGVSHVWWLDCHTTAYQL